MATRKITVVGFETIKIGETNGRSWHLRRVHALTQDGSKIEQELVTFDDLPTEELIEVELERRERTFKGKTYVNFTVKLPKKPKQQEAAKPQVPAGRYAVELFGDWRLFRVWVGDKKDPPPIHAYEVVGTEKGERAQPHVELAALTEIAKDPGKAAIEFGHRTGSCSRCGAKLERNLQRKLGIGPDCMKHWFPDQVRYSKMKAAREELRAAGLDPEAKHDSLAVIA
jgi:hypothetical protein